MLSHESLNTLSLLPTIARNRGHGHRGQPELRAAASAGDVDVPALVAIGHDDPEAEEAVAQEGGQNPDAGRRRLPAGYG